VSTRLAIVVSHPIQYYAPWFRQLALQPELDVLVFHLWDGGVTSRHDPGFGQSICWDQPLLEGYPSCFVPNSAVEPGSHHFGGLRNPGLVDRLLAWRPDALLLFGYAYQSHLQLLLDPRLWRLPILLRGDSHELFPRQGLSSRLSLFARRLLFSRFAAALAVGQANSSYLRGSGIPPSKIVLAPHAVDNARFQHAAPVASAEALVWRRHLKIDPDALVVLFAGKFEAKKRPLDLLEAFIQLRHPSAVLVFVGSGVLEASLRRRAAVLPEGRVVFAGFQNQSGMPTVYAVADLVVLPSYGSGETWGLCINEAMNLGRPVIVSSHVGCGPDLVIPGRTGWIFEAGHVAVLQRCLAIALADPQRLRCMGYAARLHIDNFSYKQTTSGLLAALMKVV
jgi:glycosyltransferase involved in cell wall biosynthesis